MFRPCPSRPLRSGAEEPSATARPVSDRSREGSLLAETLLVLPLYLALLGGLFVVGDLLLARIRGGVLDRTAAWVGRQGGTVPPGMSLAAHHKVWEGVDGGAAGWVGMKLGDPENGTVAPLRSWGVRPADTSDAAAESGGVPTQGNRWCGFYQGVSFVSAGVPFWVRLFDVGQAVHPENGDRPTASLYRIHPDHPGWTVSSDENARFGRVYVFTRRNAAMQDPPPNRCVSIKSLQEPNGGYADIVLDGWPCTPGLVKTYVRGIQDEYVRGVATVVLGEQKSGL